MDYFNYKIHEDVLCEICGSPAIDIHHIEARGMGGSKTKDVIENLMALCREHHEQFGDKKQYKEWLTKIHMRKISSRK